VTHLRKYPVICQETPRCVFVNPVSCRAVKHVLSSRSYRNLKIKIYTSVILLVDVYGCETLSLILRQEHTVRVFQDSVLRRISGPYTAEMTGESSSLLLR
jgi:hypothetical protein